MRTDVTSLLAILLTFSACLSAGQIKGKVTDPSGAPVGGAQVALVSRVGVQAQAVAAPGFSTQTLTLDRAESVKLAIAPQVDSVKVVGFTIDVAASQQGSSVSIIPREEVRERNEPYAMDLLRYVPGVTFNQTGAAGGVSSLFLRGGNSNFSLVQIDGVPVNAFGGGFDFGHIPAEAVESVELIRGPQSAVYGSYANSGVVDFVTRQAWTAPQLDLLAEGGSYDERRFGITASGTVAGFGVLASASRIDSNGMVQNNDYRNEDVVLHIGRRFGRQSFSLHGYFDSNDVGEPGPWGSNPKGIFTGIDTVSRSKNNFGEYGGHYEADISGRVRQEVFGSFFLDNSGFRSKFGFSYNKDMRGQGETRTIVSMTRHYTVAVGAAAGREEVKNTFITDASFSTFPIRRDDYAVYLENRYEVAGRLFLSAGVRGEFFRTPAIPGDGFSRPMFPAANVSKANPKLSAAYVAGNTRLHSSFGMGIRPPSGFELAFTNNPALMPERTRSVDAGVEQKLWSGKVLLDGTYFYNRYYDLIVTLGGSLTTLSHYTSDNLANSQVQGAEFSASVRPARWVFVTASYTLLETRILSLDGTSQAPLPFTVGQQLTRRPENSGNVVATFTRGRVAANVTGYFRGKTLYEEPSLGASGGLFENPGFANVGFNLNYALGRGVTAYGNLRNALDRHYEEVFGFPSPRINFVAGLKWSIARAK
jgi:outer membrane receptor protein involved in Fe transport